MEATVRWKQELGRHTSVRARDARRPRTGELGLLYQERRGRIANEIQSKQKKIIKLRSEINEIENRKSNQ